MTAAFPGPDTSRLMTGVSHPHPVNGDEDLLNLAAINAASHGAKVFVLPAREIPDANVAAGIYWLPPVKHG